MLRLTTRLCLAVLVLLAAQAQADEGQWTPDQIAELDRAKLAEYGLTLTPEQLWNADGDEATGGLLRAAVNLSGCSAAFISPDGLIATNHHCAYGALQGQSTVERDYLAAGFVAPSRDQELEAKGATVRVLRRMEDVSGQIHAAAGAATDDRARHRAVTRVGKELVAGCEQRSGTRCNLASFYNGSTYRLFEYLELRDVRLVYAPPAAVGEYGGEIDNWMWPRHTGDFTLMRAYVAPSGAPADHAADNVPYRPAQYLPVSTEGVSPGDFVAVLGYPGRTQRYMPAAEVERWIAQVLPGRVDLYGAWLENLEALAATDKAIAIKVAARTKSLANRHKNARGMLDGIAHMKLAATRRVEDNKLRAWAAQPQNRDYAQVLDQLNALSAQRRQTHPRDSLLSMLRYGPNQLTIAVDLVRRTREQRKPDLERAANYMERNQNRLWKSIERRLRDFDPRIDTAVLSLLLTRNAALPADQRIPALSALNRLARGVTSADTQFAAAAKGLVAGSKLGDPKVVQTLWNSPATLQGHSDPMLALARALAAEIEATEAMEETRAGAQTRLYPKYFAMLRAVRQGPIYPDANGTLRFSYATVKGYDKWDGQRQSAQTRLAGAVAKHTGTDPFDLPAKIREQAPQATRSPWADPALGDVPVCFLSTGDTTGGNSGSPVIDGKGRLVGLNFDRVWENIAGDFAYNIGHSRNISVDIRYLLWNLDAVEDADHLLAEIGIDPARAGDVGAGGAATASAGGPQAQSAPAGGCGCRGRAAQGDPVGILGTLGLFGVAVAWRRRRP